MDGWVFIASILWEVLKRQCRSFKAGFSGKGLICFYLQYDVDSILNNLFSVWRDTTNLDLIENKLMSSQNKSTLTINDSSTISKHD